jgi:3-oxoacyl-[acyl-carrier-protein] synthase II
VTAARVAITGTGAISALGVGCEAFADAVLAGASGLTPLEGFDLEPFVGRYSGEIRGHALEALCGDGDTLDRFTQLALIAAAEAVDDSALLELGPPPPRRLGLVMATCNGGLLSAERHYRMLYGQEPGALDGELERAKRHYSAALTVAGRFSVGGPVTTVVTACTASTNAIGLGADLLRTGRVDAVLVGGADSFSRTTFSGFDRLRTTSASPCAPFSTPTGLNLGEGAGFWVLEREDRALARGVEPKGFVLGYGLSNDAHHATLPDPRGQGLALCLGRAVGDAGVLPESIGYVNAHGTGTEANDKTESRVLGRFFEPCPPVSSTKSQLGHTLGAAGILEATASLLSLGRGQLPPTVHFAGPREACTLDYVPNRPRASTATRFLASNSAFGGANCAVVLATGADDAPGVAAPAQARSVVITGLGAVSGFGLGVDPLCEGLRDELSAVAAVQRHPVADLRCREAALVPPFVPRRVDPRLRLEGLDRCSQYAALAAKQALRAAAVSLLPRACADVGLVLGMARYPTTAEERCLGSICSHGLDVPDLIHFPFLVPNSVGGNVARELSLKGYSSAVCSSHGAGLDALGCAADAVVLGHSDCVLAGAVDEVSPRVHADLDEVGLLGTHPPGEGAVVALVEEQGVAQQRGAPILGRVLAQQGEFWAGPAAREQVDAFVDHVLTAAALAPTDVAVVCTSIQRPSVHADAVDAALGARFEGSRDTSAALGWAPALGPLFGLADALHRGAPGDVVLALSVAAQGEVRAAVVVVGARG